MKKTLIALAVLAASGASFAQVTITGNYTAGFEAVTNDTNGDHSGIGIDTSLVTFTAKEDLGNGLSATAVMSIDGLNRGGISGGDSSLALSGGFGTVTLSTGRGSDYLSGGISGVGGVGMDGKVFTQTNASDNLGYKTPSFGGLVISAGYSEDAGKRANEGTANYLGLGAGAQGAPSDTQRSVAIAATYTGGPIAATINYTSYDQAGTTAGNSKNRVSIAGAYDLGVAKLGAGFRNTQRVDGTRQDSFLAVGIPLGALTLGADWGARTHNDTTQTATGTRSGYGLKAEYALSKRTSLIASYASWEAAVAAPQRTTDTNLLISHSF